MNSRLFLLLVTAAAASGWAWANAPARLSAVAEPAVADIRPLAAGRTLLQLPELEFRFGIDAYCGPDASADSVSISVADTRAIVRGEALGGAPVEAVLRLPAQQLAPVAVDDFCPLEGPVGTPELLIRGAATAHLALRCGAADRHSITYLSKSLDVVLRCAVPDDAASQGSTSSIAR